MARELYPDWRKEHDASKYPFGDAATLAGDDGHVILEGTFLDAALFPVGGQAGLYLSRVDVDHQFATLWVGDRLDRERASVTFPLIDPPDELALVDAVGRPAGVFVSEGRRLGVFQSWATGTHAFKPAQTEFAATVCFPTPEAGVRGVLLEDGTLLSGDVWLVGADGVLLREDDGPPPANGGRPTRVVRVDVVGDPLFRRRLCTAPGLFATPRFIRQVKVRWPGGVFHCAPDELGNLQILLGNAAGPDTALRVRTTPAGIVFEVAGAAGSTE